MRSARRLSLGDRWAVPLLFASVAILAACSPEEEAAALQRDLTEAARTNPPLQITPRVGVGPVEFGMTRVQVHELLGEPYRRTGSADEYQLLGLAVMFDPEERVQLILAGAWCEPSDILLQVFKGETPEGLRLRASKEEVVAEFGEPRRAEVLGTGFEVLHYAVGNFALRDGRLVHMTWKSPAIADWN